MVEQEADLATDHRQPQTNERLESPRLIINHTVRKLIAGIVAEQIRVVRKRKKVAPEVAQEADGSGSRWLRKKVEPKKKKKQSASEKAADAFFAANP